MKLFEDFIIPFIVLILCFTFGFFLGCDIGKNMCQRNAIKAGVAEYVANEDGFVKFQYKDIRGDK